MNPPVGRSWVKALTVLESILRTASHPRGAVDKIAELYATHHTKSDTFSHGMYDRNAEKPMKIRDA